MPLEENTRLYAETVRRFIATNSPALFGNDRAEHAAIIFTEFFRNAQKRVAILCRNMATDVFGTDAVKRSMEAALLKGVTIDILVQDKIESDELRKLLCKWQSDQLPLKFYEAEGKVSQTTENIAVMDTKAFRFEPNRGLTKAFACMHNPEVAKSLESQVYEMLAEVA